jgi:inorganic pyrophosphatase
MKLSTALRKIEKLEDACAQFRADYAASKDEPENQVEGWKPTDDAKTFLRQSCELGEKFMEVLERV